MKTADNNSKFPIFSSRLTELRGVKSRQSVANDLEITRQSLEYYEKGLRLPDVQILAKIAKYYNVSADYLLGLTEQKNADKDLAAVSDYLGISDNAASIIRQITKERESYISTFETEYVPTSNCSSDIIDWIIKNNIPLFFVQIDKIFTFLNRISKADEIKQKSLNDELYVEVNRLTDNIKIRLNHLIKYYSENIANVPFHSIFDINMNSDYFLFNFENEEETKKAGD